MSRYTGDDEIAAVLSAGDEWRNRCLLSDQSMFSTEPLWSKANIDELRTLFQGNPITGGRDFLDKLREQLAAAPKAVVKLAAEVFWFYLLFPHKSGFGAETKAGQVRDIWSWSGDPIPNDTWLAPQHLAGVGGVGVAYLSRRPDQMWFLLEALSNWKGMTDGQRSDLFFTNAPWAFVEWLDTISNASKRPIRNALLYFAYPDHFERIVSNDHRKLIFAAFKSRLPADTTPKSASLSLLDLDKAIYGIRKTFEAELGSTNLDFYRSPLQEQWSSINMSEARKSVARVIKKAIEPYGLELAECGSKKPNLAACNKEVDPLTGFWKDPGSATNKPLRWIVHLDLTGDSPTATLANGLDDEGLHGNHRLGALNAAQQKSGAITIRIIPAIKLSPSEFVFYEEWEWLLLLCFYPALRKGSSSQLLEGFNPQSGELKYMTTPQPYVFAALVALNVEDAQATFNVGGVSRKIRYQEATAAIAKMINVASAVTGASESANA